MHDKDPRPPPDSAYHAGAEFLINGDYPLKLHKSATIYDISTSDFYGNLLTIIIIVNRSSNKL